jgi:hypothetical protein
MPSPTCRVSPLCESSPAARPATDLQQPTESPGSPARRSPRSAIEIDVLMGHRTRGAQTARTHARCQVQGAHHSQQAELRETLRVWAPQASPDWLPDCGQGVTHHTEVLFWLSGKGDASVWPGEPRKAHKTDRHTAVAVAHRSDTRAAMSSRAVRELEKQLMNLTVSATRSGPPPPHKHTSLPQPTHNRRTQNTQQRCLSHLTVTMPLFTLTLLDPCLPVCRECGQCEHSSLSRASALAGWPQVRAQSVWCDMNRQGMCIGGGRSVHTHP